MWTRIHSSSSYHHNNTPTTSTRESSSRKQVTMAYANYVSLTSGTPRLTPRKLYYIILATILAILIVVAIVSRTSKHSSQPSSSAKHHHFDDHDEHHHFGEHDEHYDHYHHHHEHDLHDHDFYDDTHHVDPHETHHIDDKHDSTHHPNSLADFHPTHEWQKIPDNAILPAGLEIKMDFNTGQKMARLPPPTPSSPSTGHHEDLPIVAPLANHRINTIIEQRLEDAVSMDHATQRGALDYLDVHAHEINIGASITHARNFHNLMDLMENPKESLRLEGASIITACLHSNKGAVDGAILSPLIRRVVHRLRVEQDTEVQRRFIAILSYMAEGNLEETRHQFTVAEGFGVLEQVLARGLDPASLTRALVLLAELGREDVHDQMSPALALLDRHISKVQRRLDNVWMDSFEPVCEMQVKKEGKGTLYHNIHRFCKSFYTPVVHH